MGIAEIVNGEDAHANNQHLFGLPSRLIAKIYLFRTIYRGSGWAFAHDPSFSSVSSDPDYWESINTKFYTKYHAIDKCHKDWIALCTARKPIVGPFGRQWMCEPRQAANGEFKIPVTQITNYPVQGTGADVMMIARISFFNRLKKHNLQKLKVISTVHDSIIVDTIPENQDLVVGLFHSVFLDLARNIKKLFNYDWVVPLDCECKAGNDLKNMEIVYANSID